MRGGAVDRVVLVSTYATARLPAMADVLGRVPAVPLLVVGDEVHKLGSEGMKRALPHSAQYRLGLSATPERWEDPAGTARVLEFFGSVVFEYDLDQAILDGVLTPYEYIPILVDLTEGELDDYERVATSIEAQLARPGPDRDRPLLGRLLSERSRILNSASGKLGIIRDEMPSSATHTLAYCAHRRQLAAVMDVLWDRGIAARQFTGEEDGRTRVSTLAALADGTVPVVAAIRCLDEGVDVPAASTGYLLASSGNPLQFIQRRGRLLRPSPGKTQARIVDLVVAPVRRHGGDTSLSNELRRVQEFAKSAVNGSDALAVINPLLESIIPFQPR
jgi:superfamily II DNA or RNA helicase